MPRRLLRPHLRLLLSGAGAAALLLGAPSGAAAGAAPSAQPLVLSPRQDSLLPAGKRSVPVRIRAGARAAAVDAELRRVGRSPLRVHLQRGPQGAFRGRLQRSQLRVGRNHLFVEVRLRSGRRQYASSHFTVGRPRSTALKLSVAAASAGTPLLARARIGKEMTFSASLNGHRVTGLFRGGQRNRSARLAANDGLRYGVNRLRATAFDRFGGGYRTITRRLFVPRAAPLVGAGGDRVVHRGEPIRLDGSSSRSGHGRLSLRWQIVARPDGSKARLEASGDVKPRLVRAAPGRYRIRLRATQPAGRRAAASASARPAASLGATDSVSVCVQPNVSPEGVPVQTIVSTSHPEVRVNGTSYPMARPQQSFVQIVLLDRCSLEGISNTSYPPTEEGLREAADALLEAPNDELAIVSGGGGDIPSPIQLFEHQQLLIALRSSLGMVMGPGFGALGQIAAGNFSVVSVPGAPAGSATQLIGMSREASQPAGALQGFFRLDSTERAFAFAYPAADVSFDTMAAGSDATTNVIEVDGQRYAQTIPAADAAYGGFHLLWLDAATLQPRGQESLPLVRNAWNGAPLFTQALAAIAAQEAGSLVFVSTYGSPNLGPITSGQPEIGGAALALESLGANRYAFLNLEGKGGYSFVGATGLQELDGANAGTELSEAEAGSASGRITGTLARNQQGYWLPASSGAPGAPGLPALGATEFGKVLAQPPQPFEPLEPDAQMAAQSYVFEQLRLGGRGGTLDPKFGIRRLYWENGSAFDAAAFDEYADELSSSQFKACRTPAPCARNIKAVRAKLIEEFREVAAVKRFFTSSGEEGTIAKILSEATSGADGVGLNGIASYVTSLFDPPGSPGGSAPNYEEISQGMMSILGGATGAIPGVGGVVSASFWIAEGVSQIIEGSAKTGSGYPAYDPKQFQGDVLEWGSYLESLAVEQIGALDLAADQIVSDAGRLQAMAELISTAPARGGFNFSRSEEETMIYGLQRSTAKYLWQSMLPLAVDFYAGHCRNGTLSQYPGSAPVRVPHARLFDESSGEQVDSAELIPLLTTGKEPESLEAKTGNILFGRPSNPRGFSASEPLGFLPTFLLSEASPSLTGSGTGFARGSLGPVAAGVAACEPR